jgi:hypothetical protein
MGSRGAAWLAARTTALLSPSYLLLKDFRADGTGLRGCRARCGSHRSGVVCDHYGVPAACLVPVPRDAGLSEPREYRISDWHAKNRAQARVMATGSVRFWFDAWHDLAQLGATWRNLAQLGGGSDQGLMNPLVTNAQWEYTPGSRAWHPVDAMPGRERCLRVRPWFARAVQRFP